MSEGRVAPYVHELGHLHHRVHGGQVLSGHQLADDFRRRVHELGQSLRVGVLGEAPLTLEDQPVVPGDADGR